MAFLITTTGSLGTVVINDLGARTFVHPVVGYDINQEYAIEEIRDSADLGNALNSGYVTGLYNAVVITSSAQLQSLTTIHVHDAADITTGILPIARGGSNSNTFTASEILRLNVGGTAFESIPGVTLNSLARVDAPSTYGLFLQRFRSFNFAIADVTNTSTYSFVGANNGGTSVNISIPATTVADFFVLAQFAQTLTGKSISAASNTITNIVDSCIFPHTSTKITIINKSLLNANIAYIDQANTFGAFDQTFQNLRLKIVDNSATFKYIVQTSTISADRNIIIPALTANDTFVFANAIQTLTNKDFNLAGNNLIETGAALGGIIKHNGTRYVNVPLGFANYVLSVNPGATDAAWTLPQVASLYVNSASTLTTNVTVISGNVMTGMSLAVITTGNYLVDFSGMTFNSAVASVEIEVWRQPFFGVAATIAGSLRTWTNSAAAQKGYIGHSGFRIALNALDTVTIRWRVTTGTGSMQNPTFTLIKTT